jgi:hypothetical protein
MPKVESPSPEEIKERLTAQLEWAKTHRKPHERQWWANNQILDSAVGSMEIGATLSYDNAADYRHGSVDSANTTVGINYAFKFVRFLHSQLSANPPSVITEPTSSDLGDRRSADAADRVLSHIRRDKDIQEVVDQATLKTLKKSIGWVKVFWNPNKGEIFDFNETTGEVTMQGDVDVYSPPTENVWIDADASRWSDVRHTYELLHFTKEEALFRFPEARELIERNFSARVSRRIGTTLTNNDEPKQFAPRLDVYEYYEKGLPTNGGVGIRAYMLANEDGSPGELLEPPTKNPHYKAGLPLKPLTYIDKEETLYSQSVVEYVAGLQDNLNRLDSLILENIQAHGVARIVVPKGSADESITNSPFDIYQVGAPGESPHFIQAPSLMPDIYKHRQAMVDGIQELFGINDSMLGIQRREQSAVSQQTSVEQGTAIHRRLHIKYATWIESIYRDIIGLVKENWDEKRTIMVLGKEKAFETADLKGSDVAGGFDFKVEHGASLPIDPNARREFLVLNMPLFEKAGVGPKELLKLMKLNDVGGAFDRIEMAGDRQREIFEAMAVAWYEKKPIYIAPEEGEDHLSRLEWARGYTESAEFRDLDDGLKDLLRQHVKDRKQMAAQEAMPDQAGLLPQPAGMPGVGGAMGPELGGMLGEAPAEIPQGLPPL